MLHLKLWEKKNASSQFLSRHSSDHSLWNDEKKKKNICKKLIH